MKKILSCIAVALCIAPHAAWGAELAAWGAEFKKFADDIEVVESAYISTLVEFEHGRLSVAQLTQDINTYLNRFYEILSDQELQIQTLRDRTFDIILRIIKRLEKNNFLTEPILDRFLELVENQLIPRNLLERSRGSLAVYLNKLVDILMDKSKLEKALKVINLIKMLNAQSPINQQHLKAAYNKQLTIAEKYMNASKEPQADEIAKDLPRAKNLILEVINNDSPAELNATKRALKNLFEIIFEELHAEDPSEEQLDNINSTLDDIVLGSLKSTAADKEKAQLYQIDLAIRYSSPVIHNNNKALEILDNIHVSGTTPKIRKSARELLKTIQVL